MTARDTQQKSLRALLVEVVTPWTPQVTKKNQDSTKTPRQGQNGTAAADRVSTHPLHQHASLVLHHASQLHKTYATARNAISNLPSSLPPTPTAAFAQDRGALSKVLEAGRQVARVEVATLMRRDCGSGVVDGGEGARANGLGAGLAGDAFVGKWKLLRGACRAASDEGAETGGERTGGRERPDGHEERVDGNGGGRDAGIVDVLADVERGVGRMVRGVAFPPVEAA